MIHLTTGGNGSGKTLNTLKWVRELQVQQGRSVYYANLNIKPEKAAEFGWKPFEVEKWRDLPDGAIMLIDECQDFFGPRPNGSKVPDHISDMAKHRHRGFDFFLITQHPKQLDSFIKSQIAAPGWHRHCVRPFGRDMTSVLSWPAVHAQPEKPGSGKSATVNLVAHPKDVYDWYNSATIHTNKKTIPRQAWVVLAALILVPGFIWFAVHKLTSRGDVAAAKTAADAVQVAKASEPSDEYKRTVDGYTPRIPGFPHTAPRYDKVTEPVVAPYPAACIASKASCICYTQQGTRLATDGPTCQQIVRDGYFVDWEQRSTQQRDDRHAVVADARPVAPASPVPAVMPGTVAPPPPDAKWTARGSRVATTTAQQDGEVLAAMRTSSLSSGGRVR